MEDINTMNGYMYSSDGYDHDYRDKWEYDDLYGYNTNS